MIKALARDGRDGHHVFAPQSFLVQAAALFIGKQVDLVPCLDPRRSAFFRQPQRCKHVIDVLTLCLMVWMCEITDVDDQVGRSHFLERRPERRDQLGRQIRDEADRVRQDHLVETG